MRGRPRSQATSFRFQDGRYEIGRGEVRNRRSVQATVDQMEAELETKLQRDQGTEIETDPNACSNA